MATPNLGLQQLPQNSFNIAPAYNAAVELIDVIAQLAVEDVTLIAPPATLAGDAGTRWIVAGPAPSGAWAGHANDVAYCVGADLWAFATPRLGWSARVIAGSEAGKTYSFGSFGWEAAVLGGSLAASSVTYDNTVSGMTAATAQAAIDELQAEIDALPAPGVVNASGVVYSNVTSGLVADDAQAAIDEVSAAVDAVAADVAALPAASGPPAVTALSIVAGVVNIDCSLGKDFTLSLTANVTSITFSNLPGAGYAAEIDVTFKQDATGGRTVALPASFKALGGSDTAIAATANAATELAAKTKDNGTTWRYAMQESA